MAAKVITPMASTDTSPVRYHVAAPGGNHIQVHQIGTSIVITNGGDRLVLTQTNAADLAPALTNFGANGVLS